MCGKHLHWVGGLVGLALCLVACGGDVEKSEEKALATVADSAGQGQQDTSNAILDSLAIDGDVADSSGATAVPVEVVLTATGDIASFLTYTSTIQAEASVDITPRSSGVIEDIHVEEGDRVEEGDTLLHIHDETWELNRRQWEIELDHLEKDFERTEKMYRRRLISDQEYEASKYQIEMARLNKEQAELTIRLSYVRAPFAGVITTRYAQLGASVGVGTALFSLIKLDDLITNVNVPGKYLTSVSVDQRAVVRSDFLPGREFSGWVKRISPVVDPLSGTFKVVVGLRDRWKQLRPGMFVDVRIITDIHHTAVLVPKQAVVYDGDERFVS